MRPNRFASLPTSPCDAIERLAEGGEETTEAVIALSEQHDMIVPPTDRPPYGPLDGSRLPP